MNQLQAFVSAIAFTFAMKFNKRTFDACALGSNASRRWF
jgi:hypothetical protein